MEKYQYLNSNNQKLPKTTLIKIWSLSLFKKQSRLVNKFSSLRRCYSCIIKVLRQLKRIPFFEFLESSLWWPKVNEVYGFLETNFCCFCRMRLKNVLFYMIELFYAIETKSEHLIVICQYLNRKTSKWSLMWTTVKNK